MGRGNSSTRRQSLQGTDEPTNECHLSLQYAGMCSRPPVLPNINDTVFVDTKTKFLEARDLIDIAEAILPCCRHGSSTLTAAHSKRGLPICSSTWGNWVMGSLGPPEPQAHGHFWHTGGLPPQGGSTFEIKPGARWRMYSSLGAHRCNQSRGGGRDRKESLLRP